MLAVAIVVAVSAGVAMDARSNAVETRSIAQGLQLLRFERDVGTAWGRVAISNLEHLFLGTDASGVEGSVRALDERIGRVHASLSAMEPLPAWVEVRSTLLDVSEQAELFLESGPTGLDLQTWGWDFTSDFSGIFPSDNRGEWSALLDVTRSAQYSVYSAIEYPDLALARAWENGAQLSIDPARERHLEATLTFLDNLTVVEADGESPLDHAFDLERARIVDTELAGIVARLRNDPRVQRLNADYDFLSGKSREAWFSEPGEVTAFSRALLELLDDGAEEALARAEAIVDRAHVASVRRTRIAALGGSAAFLIGAVLLVGYWRHRAGVEALLRNAAEVDPLTGVFNRFALFARCLPRLEDEANAGFAVLQIDLDDFKAINDRYGHAAGDAALRSFAGAAEGAVAGSDAIVARIGGDEFVIVLMGATDPETEAERVCSRVFDGLRAPVETNAGSFVVRATIGWACSSDPIHLDELLERADSALLDAKRSRRTRTSAFSRNTRRNLIREIGQALDEGRIVPAFQPVVRATDLAIVGLECLARWRRSDGSEVPPADFVRALNALGDRERWMSEILEASGRVLAELGDRFTGRIWVNVGAADLVGAEVEPLGQRLVASNVELDRLGLELMERVCEADLHSARACLDEVRELGVHVALDDLGSDAIPLRHLTDLPLDRVKLDGSLVESLDSSDPRRHVVEGLLAVAVNLGLSVVAERIETVAEERTMLSLGVTYLQGFRYGRALPVEEVAAYFEAHEARRRLGSIA